MRGRREARVRDSLRREVQARQESGKGRREEPFEQKAERKKGKETEDKRRTWIKEKEVVSRSTKSIA